MNYTLRYIACKAALDMDQTSDPVLSGLTYYVCGTRFSLECGILYSGNLVINPILAFGKFYTYLANCLKLLCNHRLNQQMNDSTVTDNFRILVQKRQMV